MAFCPNCGSEVSDDAEFCPRCGQRQTRGAEPPSRSEQPAAARAGVGAVQPAGAAGVAGARRTESSAVVALVLGIAGFVFCPLVAIAAVIVGYQARDKVRADPSLEGEGMAVAGIILGWVVVGLMVLGIVVVAIAAATGSFAN